MIVPPDSSGVVFSEASDGDLRGDLAARARFSERAGIRGDWAWAHQVHGDSVMEVLGPGRAGDADALWTRSRALPLAVFTADCLGVVLASDDAVGVAHAGWRGASNGVVSALRTTMIDAGCAPARAYVGPGIGACCYEVGPEVALLFADHSATTSWGTPSVDLAASVGEQLSGLSIWSSGSCTLHEPGWFSHRKDGTPARLAAVGWLP